MARQLYQKYVWLLNTVLSHPHISFDDICRRWEIKFGEDYPRRTFQNQRQAISDMFDIDIKCDRSDNTYYIDDFDRDNIQHDSAKRWILSTFSVTQTLSDAKSIQDRILLEDNPSGERFLEPIVSAMKENRTIQFSYEAFGANGPSSVTLEPYCVKLFQQRWYVFGHYVGRDSLLLYSLDRILDLSVTDTTFQIPDDFDAKEYFRYSYGVMVGFNMPVETVRIRVTGYRRYYLRTLPIHPSQLEVETRDDYSIFEYRLFVTYDFVSELLSMGPEITVLEPRMLRFTMYRLAKNIKNIYQI